MTDEKTNLQTRAESKQRKRFIISYFNTPQAQNTVDVFCEEALKFSNDYIATLQHLLETSQHNLAEALLYGEVKELKQRVAALEERKASSKKPQPTTFGKQD